MDNADFVKRLKTLYDAGKINASYLDRAINLGLLSADKKNEIIETNN